MTKNFFILLLLILIHPIHAQNSWIHSHNDYLRAFPFWEAYIAGCKSIEADVILKNDTLYVAHTAAEIKKHQTFETLYIEPIKQLYAQHNPYPLFTESPFQLLVDIKTDCNQTLAKLSDIILQHRELFDPRLNPKAVKIIISGNIPPPSDITKFPVFFLYDVRNPSEIAYYKNNTGLISRNFKDFSVWNGLGRPVEAELKKLKSFIESCHNKNISVRFWNTPDTKTAYSQLSELKVDFLNTDKPTLAAQYLKELNKSGYQNSIYVEPYQPLFAKETDTALLKNVILLIGDGMGFSQLMSGYIGNHGRLTCTFFKSTGYLSTCSADNLSTDSAAGGSAIATGKKTRNRYIGTDTLGKPLLNIMELASSLNIHTGIITSDKITGATPASFYAHQTERDSTIAIYNDLLASNINFIAGYKPFETKFNTGKFVVAENIDALQSIRNHPAMYFLETPQSNRYSSSEGEQLSTITQKALKILENDKGFFLMIECSAIDGGGHANDAKSIVNEVLHLDKAVAVATRYADTHPGTLVIVTADHETGGMVINNGNIAHTTIETHFFSNDHTAAWVPVMAYGSGAGIFTGMYENTELFYKIKSLITRSALNNNIR